MNKSKKDPIEIVARYAALDEMRKMRPEDIYKVDPEFVIKYFVDHKDDTGKIVSEEVFETNWYYALFTATMYRIDKLFEAFQPRTTEAKSNLIVPEEPKIIV